MTEKSTGGDPFEPRQKNSRPQNPPAGYTSLTPYLVVDGAERAIDFYATAFGASLISRNDGPDGRVAHAELQFPSGRLQLSDPLPEMNLVPPDGSNTVNHSYVFYCDDVDAVWRACCRGGRDALRGAAGLRHRRPVRIAARPVRTPLGDPDQGGGRVGGGGAAPDRGLDGREPGG